MISLNSVTALLLAYLLGSIPTAVWVGKIFYKLDIREYGSGNSGASNTFRILGKKAGIPVLFFDMFKGWASTNLVYIFSVSSPHSIPWVDFQLALGITAVIGHIFPIYVGFRGGKGIATLFGMLIAVHPEAALFCVAVFVILLIFTKYVSLSSMSAGIAFPVMVIFFFHESVPSLILFAIAVAVLILITHQKNIERLLRGEESKINFFKKKS